MDKKADWADGLVGDSALPADEFTWTDASNYGLDGFDFNQTMNEGVLNHGSLPGATPGPSREGDEQALENVRGMAGLPDDLFSGGGTDVSFVDTDPLQVVDAGFHLDTMLGESEVPLTEAQRKVASLADLGWLDPTQEQDPERLPKELLPDRPPLNSVPELEEAWGANRRTDGLQRVPANELEAVKYTESIKSPPPALPGVRAANEVFKAAVQHASRRSHRGHPLRAIAAELVDTLGDDPRVPAAMQHLADDHGLVGNVFVRAASFNNFKGGRWVKMLKSMGHTGSTSARYLLTDSKALGQRLGMTAVTKVPWKKALAHYGPVLVSEGYRVASGGVAKDRLRYAFLSGRVAAEAAIAENLPIDVRPADRVSSDEAFKAFKAAGPRKVEVIASMEQRALLAKRAELNSNIQKWAANGLLSQEAGLRLISSRAAYPEVYKTAMSLMTATANPEQYGGSGVGVVARQAALFETLAEKEASLEAGERKKVAVYLAQKVKSGSLTKKEAQRILAVNKPSHELFRLATMAVQTAAMYRKMDFKVEDAKEYEGPVQKAAQQQPVDAPVHTASQRKIMAASEASGIAVPEFTSMMHWARQQMSEGMMGKDFGQLMAARWSNKILRHGAELIRELRAEHEGLSGNLYVDAAAYATPGGLKGCMAGGLKHRSNQVRTVLAMPKCAGCVHGSNGFCNQYSKPLIKSASDVADDPKDLQKRAIYMADASDAEVTGSMFATSEFDLQSPMDNLTLDSALSVESLGGVLFGDGMTLTDEG